MLKWVYSLFKMTKPKVVVIVGTTGVGKSQLSIQLATKFNGEIINSDSMQVYKGVPIITNKHPIEERNKIEHHVMDHVDWNEEYYLHRFEKECLDSIKAIHKKGKIPIIVGGTHYYLQTLFNKCVENKSRQPTKDELLILNSDDSVLIYNTLSSIDPVIASKYHPNDRRRIYRMLEMFYTTGKKPSDTFASQITSLKYDTLFFWVYSSPDELSKRLDARVDKMLKIGAINEIKELYKYYLDNKFSHEQCENGVWQVIGFKEFLPWLENDPNVKLEDCIERMKIKTRQYAKKQVKWIRKMLIPDLNGQIYLLNATDLIKWDDNVATRANKILNNFIDGQIIGEKYAPEGFTSLLSTICESTSPKKRDDWKHFKCPICRNKGDKELLVIGEENWKIHLNSRRHRVNINKKNKEKNKQVINHIEMSSQCIEN